MLFIACSGLNFNNLCHRHCPVQCTGTYLVVHLSQNTKLLRTKCIFKAQNALKLTAISQTPRTARKGPLRNTISIFFPRLRLTILRHFFRKLSISELAVRWRAITRSGSCGTTRTRLRMNRFQTAMTVGWVLSTDCWWSAAGVRTGRCTKLRNTSATVWAASLSNAALRWIWPAWHRSPTAARRYLHSYQHRGQILQAPYKPLLRYWKSVSLSHLLHLLLFFSQNDTHITQPYLTNSVEIGANVGVWCICLLFQMHVDCWELSIDPIMFLIWVVLGIFAFSRRISGGFFRYCYDI